MNPELTQLITVAAGPSVAGLMVWWIFTVLKKRITDIEQIPSLLSRVIILEQQSLAHNETKDAVIRMEEQIKHLTEQVRSLADLLMRKVLTNG